ncbi:MAG TPA: serine/threonine protein kinase, partial [Desulfobacteraceae bacterium]|nr:serine/threonine protein kinase [Desulfobacteraceae bacterium]
MDLPEIPGYRVEKDLGEGGMARVYLAREEKLERLVALKVLALLTDQGRELGQRFMREARTAARLSHSHIVSIHDVGELDNRVFYMAMEFLGGGNLAEKIRHGSLRCERALEIFVAIASALDYAHGKGFIHRDVKPDNILFREDGTPVLCDFGIARAVGSATRLTKTGMSVGTPHYMSPEQARGKQLDGRSDIYSLGVVLYEMLTGKVPFEAEDSVAVAIAHVQDPVPRLPEHLAKYQPLLDKLLAKDPDDRPQTGREAAALARHLPLVEAEEPTAKSNAYESGNGEPSA